MSVLKSVARWLACSLPLLCGLTGGPVCAQERQEAVDFVRDVIPALTKAGCNAGACHGSFQGRGGLQLSLLGFDPQADFQALARDARGRRVFLSAPEQSLLLRKATLSSPHGGGRRLTADDPGYHLLVNWIADGMPAPRTDLTVVEVTVLPTEIVLQPGESAAIQVRAKWSDNVELDVTAWAQYELRDEMVAKVTPQGTVTAAGSGREAVTVRYSGQVLAVPVTVPFANPSAAPVAFERANFIDDLVLQEWQKLGLQPVSPSNDVEFLRRVQLDLIGTLPTADEIRAFVADQSPDKRSRRIEALLERPEYVDYWALKWSDLLRAHRRALGEKGLASFSGWLQQQLRDNVPFDQIARQLITAEGNLYTNGPVAYYFVDQTPEDLAETTAQVFLGVRLACARCHHHPFEVWGQEDYYSLASFFTGVTRKDNKEGGAFGGAQAVRWKTSPPANHPRTGQPLPPRAMGWTPDAQPNADVRRDLALWLTRQENSRFASTVVNRYWGHLLGRGLVHPVDDLSTTNPPVFPAVLEAVTADFVQHGYDLKHLLRTICNSRVYQLAGDPKPTIDVEGKYFTRRIPYRLPAEVLLDAINQAAGTSEGFKDLPEGTRAIALPDSNVDSYFLNAFGRPKRTSTCECERSGQLDLSQVLHLVNSEVIQQKVTNPQGRVARLIQAETSDKRLIEELYLATLSRFPDAEEQTVARQFLQSVTPRNEAAEDLLWTLLNCPEFLMKH